MFSRREFNAGLIGAALPALPADRPPNVLVILTDQQRADMLGCAGNDQLRTPNLDRLAAEGTRFSRCVSASPSCTPFRGTFQSGLYPHDHRALLNGLPMSLMATTFAQVFARQGYATGYAGKWHLSGGDPKLRPGGRVPPGWQRFGWHEWHGWERGHSFFKVWRFDDKSGDRVRVSGYEWEPTWHTDLAIEFIERHTQAGKPWLFQLSYGPPHPPEECPERFRRRYPPGAFKLAPDVTGRFGPYREARLREILSIYYGQVSALDEEVARLMVVLKKVGIERDTVIFFTSDHGDLLGSHCGRRGGPLRGKDAPFSMAFRIPLIVRAPGRVRAGKVCDALVEGVDLAPTLLELAGLPAQPQMPGKSLASWCSDGRGPRRSAVYLSGGAPGAGEWRGMWDGRWLYAPFGHDVLYDHETDPHELNNRFRYGLFAAFRKKLHAQLLGLAAERSDPALRALNRLRVG